MQESLWFNRRNKFSRQVRSNIYIYVRRSSRDTENFLDRFAFSLPTPLPAVPLKITWENNARALLREQRALSYASQVVPYPLPLSPFDSSLWDVAFQKIGAPTRKHDAFNLSLSRQTEESKIVWLAESRSKGPEIRTLSRITYVRSYRRRYLYILANTRRKWSIVFLTVRVFIEITKLSELHLARVNLSKVPPRR